MALSLPFFFFKIRFLLSALLPRTASRSFAFVFRRCVFSLAERRRVCVREELQLVIRDSFFGFTMRVLTLIPQLCVHAGYFRFDERVMAAKPCVYTRVYGREGSEASSGPLKAEHDLRYVD